MKNNFKLVTDFRFGKVGIDVGFQSINNLHNLRYFLNLMLATRFRADVYHVPTGGLISKHIHLINDDSLTLGLSNDLSFGLRPSDENRKILRWYASILEILFITGSPDVSDVRNIWFNKDCDHKVVSSAMMKLLRHACIWSDWGTKNDKDISYRTNFFDITFMSKISEATQNFQDFDYLVPVRERGLLLGVKKKTSITSM